MIFPFFKKKPTLLYNEDDVFRITIIKGDKFLFVYGMLERHDKDTFNIWVPKLREAREHPELQMDENQRVRVTALEQNPKTDELSLFSFMTEIKAIDDVARVVTLAKPKPNDIEVMELGTPDEVTKREFEAGLKIRYRAETSPHEQKSVTYKIRFNGISMLTNVQIPPPINLIVTVEIPFEQYEDSFKAKVIRSEPIPFEKKKFETVLEYLEIKEDLKAKIFEYGLLHADITSE